MKLMVDYYDIEQEKGVTDECIRFVKSDPDTSFMFYPRRNDKIYKAVIIDHPIVEISYDKDGRFIMTIEGYQCIKNCEYGKTTTTIRSE